MRVKRGVVSRRKHNKLFSLAKGYRGSNRRLVRTARQAVLHAGAYAFHGRKIKKRDFRSLWITRIAQATKTHGMSYSVFIKALSDTNIRLDRKSLAFLLQHDPKGFSTIMEKVRKA
jgi:large subunit ribosomal protein L20